MYASPTGEYYFQLPSQYVRKRLLSNAVPTLLIGSILGLITTKSFDIILISLAIVCPIYLLIYLFSANYTYVHLTKNGWEENVKIELNYKWSMRGQTMYGTVIHSEENKSIFIPTVIFETEAFKTVVMKLCPKHPLIN
jgi:hypothetical protein